MNLSRFKTPTKILSRSDQIFITFYDLNMELSSVTLWKLFKMDN